MLKLPTARQQQHLLFPVLFVLLLLLFARATTPAAFATSLSRMFGHGPSVKRSDRWCDFDRRQILRQKAPPTNVSAVWQEEGDGRSEGLSAFARIKRERLSGRIRVPSAADRPRFTFLGGGMAAGKSTLHTESTAAEGLNNNEVVVAADEFKMVDPMVVRGGVDSGRDTGVHDRSKHAANDLLVSALNDGRDILFDGTMTWLPFVKQTIEMIRNAHRAVYKLGPGYRPAENIEEYWQIDSMRPAERIPYEIHVKGVFVDPAKAVSRGIRRHAMAGRSVPIRSQLRSFKLFAQNFVQYAEWSDFVDLYDNNAWIDRTRSQKGDQSTGPPPVTATKRGRGTPLLVLAPVAYENFRMAASLNENACSAAELFLHGS